ncbi:MULTISPECIES: helix-turn-helix domain-containing protein [Paenibacillus]|jgi:DNA-binding transcriptional MerR regulator|uniref:helix-turn-helix domain-containing protein n=1 Tax=Paenibacillus TaxID=44249 RepID=UPI00264E2BF3|nr:helix-turn-helix domain-containing protein [Paenibacillus sp. 11B]MDN8590799.1 helix-turn-helix domain-containing protein [Paenibacillus sp. 11B]
MERDDLIRIIQENVLTSAETVELLGVSKQNLLSLVQRGKLQPVKESGSVRLFLKSDVEDRKREAEQLREKYRPYE